MGYESYNGFSSHCTCCRYRLNTQSVSQCQSATSLHKNEPALCSIQSLVFFQLPKIQPDVPDMTSDLPLSTRAAKTLNKMSKTTQPDDGISAFSHSPLPDDSSYIRLLTIHDLDLDKTRPVSVSCELTTWPVTEAPNYLAISYTWGDERHLTTILVNSNPMRVRRNCEYALKQAKWYDGHSRQRRLHYWVDAICINQMDDKEKGPQVALMGSIYKNADRVLACVGESDKESRYLYRKLRLRRNSTIFSRLGLMQPDLRFWVPEYLQADLQQWQRSMSRSVLVKLYHVLTVFLQRSYFSRVWVYQELFLGTKVSIYCGKERLSVCLLRGITIAANYWFYTMPKQPQLSAPTGDYVYIKLIDQVGRSLLDVGSSDFEPIPLSSALRHVRSLKCADPRDKVYGILSVVDWSNTTPICPDYTKDRMDIATEVIKATRICQDLPQVDWVVRSLDLIDHTSHRLGEAVQKRRLSPEHLVNTGQEYDRTWDFFQGWHLAYEDGKWVLSHSQSHDKAPISIRPWQEYLSSRETSTEDNQHTVILPPVTKAGDWLLIQYPFQDLWLALIARQQPDGRFDIVGKGAINPGLSDVLYQDDHTMMDVYLDIEDSIVLTREGEHFRGGFCHVPDDKITEYLETRVCGQLGSSYAEMRGISNEKDAGVVDNTDAS